MGDVRSPYYCQRMPRRMELSDKRIGTAINGKLEPKDDGGVVTLNGCENKGLQSIIARAFGAVIYGINDEI